LYTQRIEDLELFSEGGVSFTFPITGQAASAVVYFEVEPGSTLESHTDSAEEILYLVEGSVEATVGDEVGRLEQGSLAVVPANVPHGVRNTGDAVARVVGFFAAGTILSTFAEPPFPDGPQRFLNGEPIASVELPTASAM
jgi:quercetin dioxygenase-like cupin family protein